MTATHKVVKKLSRQYDEDLKASRAPKKQVYIPKKVELAKPYVRPSSAPGNNNM